MKSTLSRPLQHPDLYTPSSWLHNRQHSSNQSSKRVPLPLDPTVASRNNTSGRTNQRPAPENALPIKPWGLEKTLQPSISVETKRARRRSRSVENLNASSITSHYKDEHVFAPESKALQHADNDNLHVPRPRHNSVVANSKESTRLSAMYGWVTPSLPLEIAKGLSTPTQSSRRPRPNSVSPAELNMYSLEFGPKGNFVQRSRYNSKDRSTIDNNNLTFSTPKSRVPILGDGSLTPPEMIPDTLISPLALGLPSYMDNLAKWDPPSYSDRRSSAGSSISKSDKWGNIFGRRQKYTSTDPSSRNRRASSPSFLGSAPTMKSKQQSISPPLREDPLIQPSQGRNKTIDSGYLSFSSIDSNTSSVISALLARDFEDLDGQLESPPESPRALHAYDLPPPTPEMDISVFDRLKEDVEEVIHFADEIDEGVRSPNVRNDVPTELPLIMAATVEKLIEKLTKDIDHTFMTDFFLTFRQFMSPVRLCNLLILRFRWALHEDSEEHQLVRIRTFVVIRHWLTFYFAQDFLNLRTLRSTMSTFLNDMRSHPVILASQRDERIICTLLTVLRNQRSIYMNRKDKVTTLESQHGDAAQSSSSLGGNSDNDQSFHKTVAGSIINGQVNLNSSKDSIKGVSTHQTTPSRNPFIAMKHSISTSSVSKSSLPRRTPPATPQRSVRESNTWSMKMTFGISSIKRKVPAVYNSIVNGKSGSGDDVKSGLRPEGCNCGPDSVQVSKSASTVTSYNGMESRSGSVFRMKMGKNASTRDFDDSASSIFSTDEQSLREVTSSRPSFHIRKSSFAPSHKKSKSMATTFSASQKPISSNFTSSSSVIHTNPSCPYFSANIRPSQQRAMSADCVYQSSSTYSQLSQISLQISPLPRLQTSYRSIVLQYRSEVIGQQLCIVEQRLLRDVSWEELIELRWTKNKPELSASDGAQSVVGSEKKRGVTALIERFDAVCQWVASEIVRTKSLDSRAKVIEKFIRIALKCYHQRNYGTLTQLLVGLQSPLVSRLQQTWRRVDTYELHVLHDLQDLVKPFKNWKNVRDAMRKACDEIGEVVAVEECLIKGPGRDSEEEDVYTRLASQTGSEGKGCIPFLGVYLSDLVYNAELPSYIHPYVTSAMDIAPNDPLPTSPALSLDLVNFHKHRITASVIKHVLAFKILSVRYTLEFNSTVFPLVEKIGYLSATELREASLACE